MGTTGDPPSLDKGYVVPAPRITDAMGRALRRAFATAPSPADFSDLLHRLDAVR